MPPEKPYYFYCRECGERKPQAEESFAKTLVCQQCYDLAFDEAEEIEAGTIDIIGTVDCIGESCRG